MKAVCWYIVYFLSVIFCGYLVITEINNMPTAKYSVSQEKCISVENCDCNCETLPDKYFTTYVE